MAKEEENIMMISVNHTIVLADDLRRLDVKIAKLTKDLYKMINNNEDSFNLKHGVIYIDTVIYGAYGAKDNLSNFYSDSSEESITAEEKSSSEPSGDTLNVTSVF